jgi:hypothetical protein
LAFHENVELREPIYAAVAHALTVLFCVNLTHISETDPVMSTCDFHTPVSTSAQKNLIGPTIRKLRLSMDPKVSQQDLAGRMAARGFLIDRSAIARLETGERFIRDFEIICIAAALRVPVSQLFAKHAKV